jgi:tripartite-type tricarboxylate transporter receptor subunit TctC
MRLPRVLAQPNPLPIAQKFSPLGHARRRVALATVALAAVAGAVLSFGAGAQPAWPNKPIRFIVPYAAGGGTDVIARAIATKLSMRLGQPIIVDNRTGAGGTLGFEAAAKSPPDGYTLLFMTTAFATSAATSNKLPYDAAKDFVPIGQVGSTPLLVVVANDSPFKTLRELLDYARSKPNTVNYGSSGIGSMSHLGVELLAAEAKVQLVHVPYKGMAPAFTDLMGGNLQMTMGTFASATPLIEGGKLRGLAVTSAQRSPFAPNLPTVVEAGLPGSRIDFWWGLMAPARVPPAIVKRMNEELNAILAQPEMRELLAREAAVPTPVTPEAFGKLVARDVALWSKLIKDHNIKVD